MATVSEYATRRDKIDVLLRESGWAVKDSTKVVIEVDTKQSDFKKRDYKTVKDTLHDPNIDEKAYADYLLLDSTGGPLAIIEAKKTSRDPYLAGRKQAEGYADDIKRQTGKDVFIFLTNGYEIWFWNRELGTPRMVSGFHSLAALERIRFQNDFKKSFLDAPIKKEIIDRSYQLEAVKRVLEGIDKGSRKFLIVQATGTGKTRVAMALIDVLLNANRAQKILFLADRKSLRDQAFDDNFKVFFPNELKTKVFSGKVEKSSRLFASTIQTFMECYQQFNVGDFDVIISDEAHRSIYNKWKEVFSYFDAIEVGLTATPAELIERDTFRFFDCLNKIPTALYTYDEAIRENVLVPYRAEKTQTHFQITGVEPSDVPKEMMKKLVEEGVEPEEINFEGTDIEKKVIIIGTNEAIVKEFMEKCILDSNGTLPAKSIFFALSKQHAKRLNEAFDRLYPQYKGELARVIISEDPRAQVSLKEFKKKSLPRVAISVDMLDTGVDVPEVCNLVFAKPVFSKIKFWQMIGRGTRNDESCRHKEWLPKKKKDESLIFDCWNVFDWFGIHPEGKEVKPAEAVPARVFLLRLQQLRYFQRKHDEENVNQVKEKIAQDVDSLPMDTIAIKEHLRDVELAKSPKLWDRVGIDPLDFLKAKIAPLMRYRQGVESNEISFVSRCEQLGLAILNQDNDEISKLSESVGEALQSLPTTIADVKKKEPLLDNALSKSFWRSPSYGDSQMLINEFGPLMKYRKAEARPKIVLDIDDFIQKREVIEYGPTTSLKSEYIEDYREKVEKRIKELAERSPTIQKIKKGEALTDRDLRNLEEALNSPELFVTEENLQKVYKQSEGTLVEFIKKVLGLYEFPNPEKEISEAFRAFMIEKNFLSSDQVNFMRTIQSVFLRTHHIEFSDLYDAPFSNFGPNAPVPLLQKEDVNQVLQMCKKLEAEVFTHARR
ncbi:MAG: DEAD/DEAH box helicase family protein [Nitrososphaerales archaeon]|jgi:type I restriction enzyme R subunit